MTFQQPISAETEVVYQTFDEIREQIEERNREARVNTVLNTFPKCVTIRSQETTVNGYCFRVMLENAMQTGLSVIEIAALLRVNRRQCFNHLFGAQSRSRGSAY